MRAPTLLAGLTRNSRNKDYSVWGVQAELLQ